MEEFAPETTIEKMMTLRASYAQRPITGALELLPLCNMDCRMCYVRLSRPEMERRGRLRTKGEWLSLGRQMQKSGVLFLLLTGGEPLLFPGFREIYAGLRKLGIILTINTNGTLIDEAFADFFAEHPPRRINITLYGASRKTYASLCRYPDGFERTMRAIRLLTDRGVQVKLNGSAAKGNLSDLEGIYRIGESFHVPVTVDTYMIPALRERGLPFEAQSRLAPEQAAKAHLDVMRHDMPPEDLAAHTEHLLARIEDPSPRQYPDGVSCLASNCSFAIDWQGRMRPCVTLEEPAVPVFELGFEAAWEKIATETKRFRIHPDCVSCALRPLCPNCAGSAYLETGAYDVRPEYLCRYSRELYRLLKESTTERTTTHA